jgi:hypothetical protein
MRLTAPSALIAVGVSLASLYWGQAASDRNTIKGVVVWREDSLSNPVAHPIEDAVAVALSSDNKAISRSDPTTSDGSFSLVVPENIKEFTLLIYDKEARFWNYKPKDPIHNTAHPHDLREIVLTDKHELSKQEVESQTQIALLLSEIDRRSAALLLDRAIRAYVDESDTDPLSPKGCQPGLATLLVNYQQGQRRPFNWPPDNQSGAERMALNARVATTVMKIAIKNERDYFNSYGFYADSDHLTASGLSYSYEFRPPGYCIEIFTGVMRGNSFEVIPNMPKPSHYVLVGAPEEPGQTGDVFLYSDPTEVIRYFRWKKGSKPNFQDALPLPKDSPF